MQAQPALPISIQDGGHYGSGSRWRAIQDSGPSDSDGRNFPLGFKIIDFTDPVQNDRPSGSGSR
jgi:hypothetical protein